MLLSWVQVALDLGCLTLLTVRTGGAGSPLLAFFVFHMVFASLLLSRPMAYAGAAVAVAMMPPALLLAGRWPTDRAGLLVLAGWAVTLFLTVYLANHITRSIRQQGQRLVRQNQRIRRMSRRLRVQQQQMVQHEKMAALGQMAAGVAHEISNPLASMSSLLQLMQRQPDRPRPEAIDKLHGQVQRINNIIRQMNAFSHPAESQPQAVSTARLLAEALEMVRFDRRLSQVEVRRQFAEEPAQQGPASVPAGGPAEPAVPARSRSIGTPPTDQVASADRADADSPQAGLPVGPAPIVYVQPHALQQVLINLVLNALDAMEDAPLRRLTLTARRADDWCLIEVADTGHGIAPEHMDRLFEPFFTTKPVGRGTGLGLAISYSLISKQGGRIEVRSTPGRGTTFILYLPPADHFQP